MTKVLTGCQGLAGLALQDIAALFMDNAFIPLLNGSVCTGQKIKLKMHPTGVLTFKKVDHLGYTMRLHFFEHLQSNTRVTFKSTEWVGWWR